MIEQTRKTFRTRILNEDEYRSYLNLKLQEELEEYLESGDVSELADMVEVINTIVKTKGVSPDAFEELREEKKKARGGFDKQLLLESVD